MIVWNQRQLGEQNLKYAKDEVGDIKNMPGMKLARMKLPRMKLALLSTMLVISPVLGRLCTQVDFEQLSNSQCFIKFGCSTFHVKAEDIAGNVYSVEEGGAGENQVILAI